MVFQRIKKKWARFWMCYAGLSFTGRMATRFAACFSAPYKGRGYLARLNPNGYFAPSALISHNKFYPEKNVFIGERVIIYQAKDGGPVRIGKGSKIHLDNIIETGRGGSLSIGYDTHIQPRCVFSAYVGSIKIGAGAQIAPYCTFYPYNHSFSINQLIKKQPLYSKGGIVIGDDAWLGVGVTVLDNVRIGNGAVIGAGSIVTCDIPNFAIAVGSPAYVVKMRSKEENINM